MEKVGVTLLPETTIFVFILYVQMGISEKVSELSPALQAKVTKSKMVSQLLGLQQTVVKQVGATDGGVGFAAHTVGEGAKTTGGGGGGGGAKTPKGEPKKTTSAQHSNVTRQDVSLYVKKNSTQKQARKKKAEGQRLPRRNPKRRPPLTPVHFSPRSVAICNNINMFHSETSTKKGGGGGGGGKKVKVTCIFYAQKHLCF